MIACELNPHETWVLATRRVEDFLRSHRLLVWIAAIVLPWSLIVVVVWLVLR